MRGNDGQVKRVSGIRHIQVETVLAIWDIQAILSAEDALEDFGGFEIRHWGALANVDEDIIEIGNLELDTSQIEQYAFAVDAEEGWGFVVVKGSFFFDDIRDELEDAGFEEDSYRKYEFWTGSQMCTLRIPRKHTSGVAGARC